MNWKEDLRKIDDLPLDEREEARKVNKKYKIKILIFGVFFILIIILLQHSGEFVEFIQSIIK